MKIKYNTLNKKEVVSLNTEETLILRRYKPMKIKKGSRDSVWMVIIANMIVYLIFKVLMINYIIHSKDGYVTVHILFRHKKTRNACTDVIESDIRQLIELKNPEVQNIEFI